MGVKERILEFCKVEQIPIKHFEEKCGMSNGYVSSMRKGLGYSKLENVLKAFPQLNKEWLLNGNGVMFQEQENRFRKAKGDVLPLIPFVAMGGYNEDNWTAYIKDCPLYAVPDIKTPADFLIRVGGESMSPKYIEGDMLVCKMLDEVLFFQWGKTYVLDTSQGVMVKNIYEDTENKDNILLVSENKDKYPPFSIPRSDIRKIALVVGSLRIRMCE